MVDCGLEACDEGVVAEQGAAACPPQWGTPPQFGLLNLPNNAHALPYSGAGVLLLISTLLVPTSAAAGSSLSATHSETYSEKAATSCLSQKADLPSV